MRHTRWLVHVLVLLVPAAVGAAEAGTAPAARQEYVYIIRSLNQTMMAECSADVKPDRAVIVGGITAESLKPAAAKAQIDRQLAEVQKYVSQRGGTVAVMERVRAVRGTPRDVRDVRRDQLPFVVVQRVEMEFPVGVDIDETLGRVLQLGLDRYGKGIRLNVRDTSPRVVVRYRFSNLIATLKDIHRQCKARAVQRWCATNTPAGEHRACTRALGKISDRFITKSLRLQSRPVLGAHGQTALVQISYPWNETQIQAIELVGDVALRLYGTIAVATPGARGW
ncbi:MAG: SIMPL domain-containing protein [Candidatus Methylomirabilales bacterium]